MLIILTLLCLTLNITAEQPTPSSTPQQKTQTSSSNKTTATKKSGTAKKKQPKKPAKPAPAQPQTTPAPATTPPAKTPAKQRTITVSNTIQDKMLAYKYGFISYSPSNFTLWINDEPLERGNKKNITINDGELKVRYSYEFLGGKRKGSKLVTFKVPEDTNHLDLTFSWHDKWHVLTNKATPVSIVAL